MFDRGPFRGSERHVDALATGDGEGAMAAVLALDAGDAAGLRAIPGLAIPGPLGWTHTPRATVESLDALPSPMRMGLLPRGRTVCLETYRGCPMSCAFCAWAIPAAATKATVPRKRTAWRAFLEGQEIPANVLVATNPFPISKSLGDAGVAPAGASRPRK